MIAAAAGIRQMQRSVDITFFNAPTPENSSAIGGIPA
jgi:hypothetical protein